MPLPNTFQFSQSSLQDFDTCPRRFKLRYLDKLRWPAVESEPVEAAERLAELGQDFHRLVQQHLVGLDVETLDASLENAAAELQGWWQNYLAHRPAPLAESQIYPELALSTPLRGYRLLARFDVLAAQPDGTFAIIDWKTSEQKPAREVLEQRMQTHVYPYVLATAGAAFNKGRPIKPAAIKMIYWYPQYPTEPEIFDYNQKLLRRDERLLSDLIEQVKQAAERDDFPLVESQKPCTYCIYRSLCNRGVQAGPLMEWAEDKTGETDVLALEWDQIAEIQF
jgi:CRISPR/Cas system-associated exonuclease Cas4 (RecB family)